MTTQKHMDLIDLLKGFAILSVIYLHSEFSAKVSKAVLAPFLFSLAGQLLYPRFNSVNSDFSAFKNSV